MNNHLKSQDLIYNVNFLIYIMFIIMQQYHINLEWFNMLLIVYITINTNYIFY